MPEKPLTKEEMIKMIDERIKDVLPQYLQSQAFTERKLTDTPTDALSVVNRKYTNLNGVVADRPSSSIATIGQKFFATDTNIPMTWNGTNWVNGVSSVVA